MIYRETGNFVTNYLKDRQIINLSFDKYFLIVFLLIMLFYEGLVSNNLILFLQPECYFF